MATVIDMTNIAQCEWLQVLQWRAMLRIEINTGMSHSRRKPLTEANQYFFGRREIGTKKKMLAFIEEVIARGLEDSGS